MKSNLRAGMWIAQGPEMDILVTLTGEAPLLEFVCGLDLNSFKRGVMKTLSKESREIQDMLMYPDKYIFEAPNVSAAINNENGLGKTTFESIPLCPEKEEEILDYYINVALPSKLDRKCKAEGISREDAAKNMTAIYIKHKYSYTLGHAFTLLAKVLKTLAKYNQ